MQAVLDSLATDVISTITTIASGSFGQIIVFFIAIGLLFYIVRFFQKTK